MIVNNLVLTLFCGLVAVSIAAMAAKNQGASDSLDGTFEHQACDYVRTRLGFGPAKFLRAVRREDFEDDLFAEQSKIRGEVHKAARFFEVTETGYEIVSPDEAVFHSSVDGAGRWLVAVSSKSNRVYGLVGFEDALKSFNMLTQDSNVVVVTEPSARSWAFFFLKAVIAGRNGFWLSGPFDLRRAVEDVLEGHAQSAAHPITASQWMRNLQSHKVRPVVGMVIHRLEDGYEVSADSVSSTGGLMPVLKETNFEILPNGTIVKESVSNLFPVH